MRCRSSLAFLVLILAIPSSARARGLLLSLEPGRCVQLDGEDIAVLHGDGHETQLIQLTVEGHPDSLLWIQPLPPGAEVWRPPLSWLPGLLYLRRGLGGGAAVPPDPGEVFDCPPPAFVSVNWGGGHEIDLSQARVRDWRLDRTGHAGNGFELPPRLVLPAAYAAYLDSCREAGWELVVLHFVRDAGPPREYSSFSLEPLAFSFPATRPVIHPVSDVRRSRFRSRLRWCALTQTPVALNGWLSGSYEWWLRAGPAALATTGDRVTLQLAWPDTLNLDWRADLARDARRRWIGGECFYLRQDLHWDGAPHDVPLHDDPAAAALTDGDRCRRSVAARWLAGEGTPEAHALLRRFLATMPTDGPDVRYALTGLGHAPEAQDGPLLAAWTQRGGEQTRLTAFAALRGLDREAALVVARAAAESIGFDPRRRDDLVYWREACLTFGAHQGDESCLRALRSDADETRGWEAWAPDGDPAVRGDRWARLSLALLAGAGDERAVRFVRAYCLRAVAEDPEQAIIRVPDQLFDAGAQWPVREQFFGWTEAVWQELREASGWMQSGLADSLCRAFAADESLPPAHRLAALALLSRGRDADADVAVQIWRETAPRCARAAAGWPWQTTPERRGRYSWRIPAAAAGVLGQFQAHGRLRELWREAAGGDLRQREAVASAWAATCDSLAAPAVAAYLGELGAVPMPRSTARELMAAVLPGPSTTQREPHGVPWALPRAIQEYACRQPGLEASRQIAANPQVNPVVRVLVAACHFGPYRWAPETTATIGALASLIGTSAPLDAAIERLRRADQRGASFQAENRRYNDACRATVATELPPPMH